MWPQGRRRNPLPCGWPRNWPIGPGRGREMPLDAFVEANDLERLKSNQNRRQNEEEEKDVQNKNKIIVCLLKTIMPSIHKAKECH
jgi:hypothetical protein